VRRVLILLTALALLVPAHAALAQKATPTPAAPTPQPGSSFGALPQLVPTETATPTPTPTATAQQDTDRKLLFAIGAALIVLFVVIGRFITRDARQSLPEAARTDAQLREQGPHKHARKAKAKARAKTKAQRAARRQNR
jgi:Na+-transporting methylmalonyl-CoA/oxaloacetate decarboxylase gamma subunit